uniref:Uncharacterized protein n=1 Tax=Caenorhabditis japonica TaxID=281687 RepID=A0A8R1EG84_CAEJA
MLKTFKAIIKPLATYAGPAWHQLMSDTRMAKLERQYIGGLKACCGLTKDPPKELVYCETKMMPLKEELEKRQRGDTKTIQKRNHTVFVKRDTVPHPPYTPDIAPSDYHLFRPLKLFLKEKRFAKYEDLKMAMFDFFDSQSAAF